MPANCCRNSLKEIRDLANIVVAGSGVAGMSAACFLARDGHTVTVAEKLSAPGGRVRQLKENGFTFDMGPSWYWMPDVFERFFQAFGKKTSDYYTLRRLDPSYRVYFEEGVTDIPASYAQLQEWFEQVEPGSSRQLDKFVKEAAYKYRIGMQKLVYKPGKSFTEFLDIEVIRNVFRLDVFRNMRSHVAAHFQHPKLRQLLEFPVLFLGAMAEQIPALYSLMNYADIIGGTWYPEGGMYKIAEAQYSLAKELGVQFLFNTPVEGFELRDGKTTGVRVNHNGQLQVLPADVVVSGADYHFTEQLLPEAYRSYSTAYWDKRVMAPGCLLYYVGLNRKLQNITHHTLFFDTPFEQHAQEIYATPQWPGQPLFYACASSVTDASVAPAGCENLFLLVPVAAGLTGDDAALRERYFDLLIQRLEHHWQQPVRKHIVYQKSYGLTNFIADYNSFKGNAYGLANTLLQTAVLKPKCQSAKVKNLFYTGQLTVPGPGLPPSLISGELVAGEVVKYLKKQV